MLKFEKGDFYKNKQGNIILTEKYHVKRGRCCGSGCKHCPYDPPHFKMNKNLKKEIIQKRKK